MSRDTWMGQLRRPSTLNKWIYTLGNPINFIDPSGFASECGPQGTCGPDVTDWFMTEVRKHYNYGVSIRSLRDIMTLRAKLNANPLNLTFLFDIAKEEPFNRIVSEFTFPYTGIPIGVTPVNFGSSEEIVGALGLLEYAAYGLAADYAFLDYHSGIAPCGTGGCDLIGKGKKTATLCGKCIDVSDLGNIMFGLGGAARGYPFIPSYVAAGSYNVLADWIPSGKKYKDLLPAFLSPDGRAALIGWEIGNTTAFGNRSLFCGEYVIGRLITGGYENGGEASQCSACSTTYSPITYDQQLTLYRISRNFPDKTTIKQLMERLGKAIGGY